ncbi:MAG: hypothetical protein KatS3mg015_2468 [Fimbriimonadales bacterium]|nr:MAG: hypothetical protein KatS3mg015_2468 [Fimbriimonadales bacterium]
MRQRPRDPIWDALTEHFGPVRTPQERKRRNTAVRDLRIAEATPEEIAITYAYCREQFGKFTEMAICSWLSRALHEREKSKSTENVIELAFKRKLER